MLTLPAQPTIADTCIAALLSAALAGVIAALPERFWNVACIASVLALPFTIWWCGVAAIDHVGPGLEAARAALSAAGTNHEEALGAVTFVARHPAFFVALAGHCLLLFLACATALRRTPAARKIGWRVPQLQLVMLISLLPLAASALQSMDGFKSQKRPFFGPSTFASPLGSASEIAIEQVRLLAWYHERGYRRQPARASKRITAPMLAIFIVGESARAQGYGAMQAGRGAASHELAARISEGLGSWLPETCASSDATHLSVPLLLTATAPQDRDRAAAAPTVLGILKADGFATAWLANNEAGADAREAGHDLYAGRFEINPDKLLGTRTLESWKLDEDMIPTVEHFVGHLEKPKALILHFFGSHIDYPSRYPAGFFPAEPEGLSDETREQLRYDRSLEYEARTILQVAAILDAAPAPAFLVYTSDHGENLHSDHNGVVAHLGPRTTQRDGTVPSFALWNRAMADSGVPARAVAKLVGAKQIAHADVATLFLTLAGINPGPVEPTPNPTIWGRIAIGDDYSPVRCSQLKP